MSRGNPTSRPAIFARTGSKSTNHDLNSARAIASSVSFMRRVQVDLVVQRAEDVGDSALFFDRAPSDRQSGQVGSSDSGRTSALLDDAANPRLTLMGLPVVVVIERISKRRGEPHTDDVRLEGVNSWSVKNIEHLPAPLRTSDWRAKSKSRSCRRY